MKKQEAKPVTDSNANDSVEASLEDFISQANKSFQEPADGWTLNTDEVELVDETDLAPVKPAKIAAAVKGAAKKTLPMGVPVDQVQAAKGAIKSKNKNGTLAMPMMANARSSKEMKAESIPVEKTEAEEKIETSTPSSASSVAAVDALSATMPASAASLGLAQPADEMAIESDDEPEAPAPPAARPSAPMPVIAATAPVPAAKEPTPTPLRVPAPAAVASTAVVPPLPAPVAAAVPATSNPLVLFGVMFGAFLLGAVVVWFMIRAMGQPQYVMQVPPGYVPANSQPQVVPQAQPVAVPVAVPAAPVVAAPVAPAAPVVTAIAAPAVAPVGPKVTPLPAAAPVAVNADAPPSPSPAPGVKHVVKKRPVVAAAPAPHKAVKQVDDPFADKPKAKAPAAAPAPAAAKPAAKPKKQDSGDFVDPFAQ